MKCLVLILFALSFFNSFGQSEKSLAYLKKFYKKYPSEIRLLESEPLRARLKNLVGSKYERLVKNMGVQTPIEVSRQVVFVSGCLPHSCGSDEAAICVDTQNDAVHVGILSDEKLTLYYESPNVAVPALFKNWLTNYPPARPIYRNKNTSVFSPPTPKPTNDKDAIFGIIQRVEAQGNAFLDIQVLTNTGKRITLLFSSTSTTVYQNNEILTDWGSVIAKGTKIKITKRYQETGMLRAKRIDILN
jgi:hypothetical protein